MPVSVSVPVTLGAKSYQILSRVIAQTAPRLDVMDLEIFCSPADLATPAVPLEDLMAQLTRSGVRISAVETSSQSAAGANRLRLA